MTTSGVTTLFGHNRTSPLWKRCGHISSCTEIARRQRTTGGRRGGGVKGRHGMCVCPQQRHKCFTNAAQTLRQELIKKKCAQHEKQLKKLFLHNNITCQNCSLEKYFAIFGCEFLHKMSATSKTFRRCLFFFFFFCPRVKTRGFTEDALGQSKRNRSAVTKRVLNRGKKLTV